MTRARTPQPEPASLPLDGQPMDPAMEDLTPAVTAQLVTRPPAALAEPRQAPTPMTLLTLAMERGDADLDRLERLMLMQERWEEGLARKAFNAAFSAFKAEAVRILRTKLITDGPLKGKKQAELGAIITAVTPALSKHGLSLSYRLTKDDPAWMEVATTLRHVDGHSETVTMGGPPDTGPGRNAMQARGSTKTYLERYTTTAILGLAPEDDDDGRGGKDSGEEAVIMPEGIFQAHLKAIKEAKNDTDLKAAYTTAQRACHQKDPDTMKAFTGMKNERYRELHATRQGGAQ